MNDEINIILKKYGLDCYLWDDGEINIDGGSWSVEVLRELADYLEDANKEIMKIHPWDS